MSKPSGACDRWDDERRRYLSMFSSIGMVLGAFYFVQSLLHGASGLPLIHAITVATMTLAKVVSSRAVWTGWGTLILLFGVHNFVVLSSILDGLTRAPGLWSIAALPMATALLSTFRATIVASVVAFLDVLAISWIEGKFVIVRDVGPLPDIVLSTMLTTIFVFSLFSFLNTSSSFSMTKFLEIEKDELQAANRASVLALEEKKIFLAKMSHEIRTPMNGLLGCVRELQKECENNDRLRDTAAQVQRDADNLLVALDVCLDTSATTEFSRSTSSQIAAPSVDLIDFLEKTAKKIERMPQWSRFRLETDLDEGVWFCELDVGKLEHLLVNIAASLPVSIALPGSTLRVRAVGDAKDWIDIEIGGLQQKARLDDTLGSTSGGQDLLRTSLEVDCVSLAQAVSLQLIHEMGAVPLVTQDGAEHLVGVRIPFFAAPRPIQGIKGVGEVGARAKVLVVDDNAINLKIATLLLRRAGCEVSVAENGLVAVQKAHEQEFDLVLMDMRMPVMNGLDATRRIRSASRKNTRTPIVALTANAFEADRRACLNAGMVEHLAKPLKPDALDAILARYCPSRASVQGRRCA